MDDEFRVTAQELPGAIESLLFVSGDPISADKLAELLNVKKSAVEEALKSLMSRYKNNPWGGLEIRKIEESYAIMTRPEQKKFIERLYAPKAQVPLGIWSMYDLHEQNSREFFGTDENKIIDGKVLVLYVDVNDSFCFVRTETADEMLTISNDTPYPTALMIWYL